MKFNLNLYFCKKKQYVMANVEKNNEISDCWWSPGDPLMKEYHDMEWGVPLHDDRKLFEFMVLDAFQAGLSWKTILYKREGFRRAFDNFEAKKIAQYDEQKVQELMQDASIIRNQAKIRATITNARQFITVQQEFGSFDAYIWLFTGETTIHHHCDVISDIPARSPESDAMSKDLQKRGFKFVGSTICYAFMQAAGMINDHLNSCSKNPLKA
ncbi:MAG: DNA-3-methyladenine glycosylase [Bacteroidetes bacterium]|nr:DNA-3-methyladenine glycosylase [Bacteroidota bacterium]